MARSIAVLCLIALLATTTCHAARPLTEQAVAPARGLLQWGNSRWNRNSNLAANTVRSQAATSQAIEEAVLSGANGYATRRAGVVGSTMTWASAQNNQNVFNVAERWSGPWGRK